jgi:2-methylisocitrate lyase-like PEP mutase family enzyme
MTGITFRRTSDCTYRLLTRSFRATVLKVSEVIAVVRQPVLGDHRHGFGNGRLSVVGLVELFREFHVCLLLFSGG